jgi:hypothetical protein
MADSSVHLIIVHISDPELLGDSCTVEAIRSLVSPHHLSNDFRNSDAVIRAMLSRSQTNAVEVSFPMMAGEEWHEEDTNE